MGAFLKIDDSAIKTKNEELEKSLSNARSEWTDKITKLVESIRFTNKLTESQIYGLSYRQELVENIAKYKVFVFKKREAYEKMEKDRFRSYSLDYDIRLSAAEINKHVKADLGQWELQINILNTHIDFMTESVKCLDSFNFAIKNKITVITEEIV